MGKRVELEGGLIGETSRVMDPEAVNQYTWRVVNPSTGQALYGGAAPSQDEALQAIQKAVQPASAED